jgi:cytochrome c-type biogenesis protein CcmH
VTNAAFLIAALVAVLLALAFVLVPLLRTSPEIRDIKRRQQALDALAEELEPDDYRQRKQRLQAAIDSADGQSSASPGLIIGLLLALPLATWLLYQQVGEPQGLQTEEAQVHELRSALVDLARQLERNPDSVDNWTRLGLIYKDLREHSSAEHAFRRALYLDENNDFIQVELAETLLFASQGARLPAEARQLLEQAVSQAPDSQKGLWLLGISAFQDNDYAQALQWWQQLDALLPPGSVRNSVREQMQRAESRLGQGPTNGELPEGHPAISQPPQENQPRFEVAISLDPALQAELTGTETVYLIARAASGPAAPLAVHRLQAADLPTRVFISDADAMVEGLTLSSFPDIMLVARVSFSGDAQARAGDFEGRTGPVSILDVATAEVSINQRLSPDTN